MNEDVDNEVLTYRLTRDGTTVFTGTRASRVWDNPWMGYTDTGLAAGSSHTYRVRATDPDGHFVAPPPAPATVDGPGSLSPYPRPVMTDGASHYWRLGDTGG